MSKNHSWIIGAAADCQVVVEAPTVSSRHCRLAQSGTGLVLEDLGSKNGTFVNGRRVLDAARVARGDQIGLGSDVVLDLEFLLDKLTPQARVSPPRRSVTQLGLKPVLAVAALLTVALLSVAVAQFSPPSAKGAVSIDVNTTNNNRSNEPAMLASNPTVSTEPSAKTEAIALSKSGADGEGDSPETSQALAFEPIPAAPQPVAPVEAAHIDPLKAVFAVLAPLPGSGEKVQIGTAWAATDHELVTTGSVLQTLKAAKVSLSSVTVRCQALGMEFDVADLKEHSDYAQLIPQIEAALKQVQQIERQITAVEQQGRAVPEKQEKEFDDAVTRMSSLSDQSAFFNIGVLRVESSLPVTLPITSIRASDSEQALETPVSVLGGGPRFDESDRSRRVLPPESLACEDGSKRNSHRGGDLVSHWQWTSMVDHTRRDWRGSPVLDATGRVIAVFVRPVPPSGSKAHPSANQFDAVSIEQLRFLLPKLFEQGT